MKTETNNKEELVQDNHTYIDKFKEHLKIKNYAKKTVTHHLHAVKYFLKWLDANNMKLTNVTKDDLMNYDAYLKGKNFKKASVLSFMHSVKRYFEFLESNYIIFINPMEDFVLKKVEPNIPVILTRTEIDKLLNEPNLSIPAGVRDRTILEVMYSGAIRLNETHNLDLFDVDLGKGILRVRNGKFGKDRFVPLSKIACKYIQLYLKEVRPKFTKNKVKERALFVGERGRRMHSLLIGRMVRNNAKSAGIKKNVTPHMLRHTCACHLIENDVGIESVRQLLGHSRVSVTQHYTQVNPLKIKAEHQKHPREGDNE